MGLKKMSQNYPRNKETTSKKDPKMFSTPFVSRVINIVCPAPPIKCRMEYPIEIVIDDGRLHEVVIHKLLPRQLIF